MKNVLVDKMGSYTLSLLFMDYPFFVPLDWFPAFELDEDLICTHVFEKIEEDETIDGVTSDVEGLVDFYEHCGHQSIKYDIHRR